MKHETNFIKVELMPGQFVSQHSTLPSILTRKGNELTIVTNGKCNVGDDLYDFFLGKEHKVSKVLETRKAKGDWSGKSHEGVIPIWSKIIVD